MHVAESGALGGTAQSRLRESVLTLLDREDHGPAEHHQLDVATGDGVGALFEMPEDGGDQLLHPVAAPIDVGGIERLVG
jgi:hypothetical protein